MSNKLVSRNVMWLVALVALGGRAAAEPAPPPIPAGVIIPKKGLLEIKKVLEQGPNAKLAVKTPHVFLVQDDIAIAVKLIDAQFPPYDQVIPRDHKKIITVDSARPAWRTRCRSSRSSARSS